MNFRFKMQKLGLYQKNPVVVVNSQHVIFYELWQEFYHEVNIKNLSFIG